MEVDQEETKRCTICDKDIAKSKFRMHEMGCMRQNYKCPKCKQCVAKADKEEHDQLHEQTTCPHCKISMEKIEYENHLQTCDMKPLSCPLCDVVIKGGEAGMQQHQNVCAEALQQCIYCNKQIKRSRMQAHQQSDECVANQSLEQQQIQEELKKFQMQEFGSKVANKNQPAQQQEYQQNQFSNKPSQQQYQYEQDFSSSQNNRGGNSNNYSQPQQHQQQQQQYQKPEEFKHNEDQMDEDQKLIAKLLEEDENMLHAQNIQNDLHQVDENQPMSNYERSKMNQNNQQHQVDQQSENYYKPVVQQQLIGGSESPSENVGNWGGMGSSHHFQQPNVSQFQPSFPQQNSSSLMGGMDFQQPNLQHQNQQQQQNFGDEDNNDNMTEDEMLAKAMAESLEQQNVQQNQNNPGQPSVDDTEEEILRQIIEQSKNIK